MKKRLINLMIALDQFVYVLVTLGYGSPDETMSSAAWRMEVKGKWSGRIFRPLIDWIFENLGDEKHFFRSYIAEKYRIQLPRNF